MDVAAAEAHLKNLYFRCMHNWQYDKTNDDLTVAAFVLGRALWPTFQSCMRSLVFCTVWLLLLARCFCSGLQADWLDTVRNCIAWLWLKNRGVVFLFFFNSIGQDIYFLDELPGALCVCVASCSMVWRSSSWHHSKIHATLKLFLLLRNQEEIASFSLVIERYMLCN